MKIKIKYTANYNGPGWYDIYWPNKSVTSISGKDYLHWLWPSGYSQETELDWRIKIAEDAGFETNKTRRVVKIKGENRAERNQYAQALLSSRNGNMYIYCEDNLDQLHEFMNDYNEEGVPWSEFWASWRPSIIPRL